MRAEDGRGESQTAAAGIWKAIQSLGGNVETETTPEPETTPEGSPAKMKASPGKKPGAATPNAGAPREGSKTSPQTPLEIAAQASYEENQRERCWSMRITIDLESWGSRQLYSKLGVDGRIDLMAREIKRLNEVIERLLPEW
jgi:hypothetical protein